MAGNGAGTTAVAGSVAGAKGALKASGIDTTNMSAFEATLQCFKSVPSSIGKSFNSFKTGAALTNIKNAFGINKKESSERTKTDNKSLEETENIKNEAKPKAESETKPEVKAETKTEVKAETKPEVTAETKPEVVQQDIGAEGQSGYSKKLASLSEEEAAAFERAKNILDSQGIEYSDEELLTEKTLWRDLDESLTHNGAADCHGPHLCANNHELRNAPESYIPELRCRIFDKGLENLSPLKQNETVYRGVVYDNRYNEGIEYVKSLINAKKGEVMPPDKGYSYASYIKEIATHYCKLSCDAPGVRMKIIVPKGSKVSYGKQLQEIIFPRNAQFEVVEQAKMAEDGIMEIVLKYIVPKD